MKKLVLTNKNFKNGMLLLLVLLCGLFANNSEAQVTNTNFFWGGTVNNLWSTAANWSTTGRFVHAATFASGSTTVTIDTANLATTGTILAVGHAIVGVGIPANTTVVAFSAVPAAGTTITLSQPTTAAGSAALIQTYLKSSILPFATTGNSSAGTTATVVVDNATLASPVLTGARVASFLLMRNTFGPTTGTTLTINAGASLTINHYGAVPCSIAGGNIVNNGTLTITSTSAAASSGIACIIPTVLPGSATTYGYSGTGALNLNVSASTTANSAAFNVTSLNANTTYSLLFNSITTFSLGSATTSFAIRHAGGASSSPLVIGGTGFTIGSASTPIANGGLLSLGAATTVTVNSGTTLSLYTASTNLTTAITSFSSSATATNFTNLGEINILGSSARSGLSFSSGASGTASVFNISNQGTLNVDLTIPTVGSAPFIIGNGGGGNVNAGTVVNLNNTATGVLTLKNNSTAVGAGQAIFCTVTGEAAPLVINNSGTLNLEGTVNTFTNKTTLNNTGFITTNNELRHFTAINNNTGGEISFFNNASTAVTRQVQFNGLTTASASSVGAVYTYGGNTFVVITQKYTGSGTTLTANVLSSASVVSAAGSLTLSSGTGDASIAFTSISIVATNNAIVGTCTNSGTIYTASGTNLNIISGVSDASAGAIVPGSSLYGITDLKKASTTPNGILRIQVAGTTAGVDYDQMVNTAGSINVGSLDLNVVSLYTPAVLTTISIISATAITGTLVSATGLTQVPVGWALAYTATTVDLVYTPPTFTTTTWNGSVDTDWTVAANWTGGLPSNLTDVVIAAAANQPLIAASAINHIRSLTLNPSTILIVNAGATLTITDAITNNGTLIFENNANLVQVNNAVNTGNIVYKRTTPNLLDTDYTYWSSPVVGQTLAAISPINYDEGRYYSFDTILNDWSIWLPHTTVMLPSVGYIMRGKNIPGPNIEATFTGVPNNGVLTTPTGAAGNNCLMGNPYPSAIDADAFLGANIATIEGTLYFWTHNTPITNLVYTSGDYASYNGTGGVAATTGGTAPTGKIAATQGFFATSKTASTVTFNNFMRFDGSGTPFDNTNFYKTKNTKKAITIEKHRVWLNLTNTQGAFKQILVGYVTNATNEYDSAFDGRSFNGNAFVDFYSVVNNKRYTIQGRALPFDENDEVPLGYRSTIAGEFSININQVDGLLTNQAVFLEDKLTNTIVNLKTSSYTFTTAVGVFNERFVLRFVAKTLSTNDFEGKSNQVYVSVKNKQLKINAVGEAIKNLTIYDLSGRTLYQKNNIGSNELTVPNFVSGTQTVMLKIILQSGTIVSKKVIF
ncbi:T9SS sorting signal type C domain-containing protein [Flavobacterium sp.]|uniref:T9SS sorting signal type C domain-containing protein n=1 Tax=Flavobacterium sp. TaxID=239 RepID=UPI00286E0518|nr:T9SS sorting signal type C domain-containing protein [Flavobacterium sp.]